MVTAWHSSPSYALADLALALTRSAARIDGVCETAVRAATEMVGDAAAVQLVGEDGRYDTMVTYHPDADRSQRLAEALSRRGAEPDDPYSQTMRATRRPVTLTPLTAERLADLLPAAPAAGAPGVGTLDSALLAPLIADNTYLGYLLVVRTGSGSPYAEADAELVRDIAGEVSLALASAWSLERLRISEEKYRRVLETIPEGVLQIDAAGITTFANQPGATLLGLPREQLVGLPLRGFLDDRGQRQLARWLAADEDPGTATPDGPAPAVDQPGPTEGSALADARVVRADGSTRTVRLCLTRLQEDHGHPGGSLCMVTDRTEHVDARGLKRQLDHLRRLDSMGQLIGGIAHDLNNLLTIVGGSADMIAGSAEPGSSQHQLAAEIVHAAVKGRALAHQLLAFGRGGSRPETIRVPDLLDDVKPLFARTLGEHIHLDFGHNPDVWPVRAERGPLQQVLVNLAANARDAMMRGGVMTVQASNVVVAPGDLDDATIAGRFVRLIIADTGGGMDEHTRQRALEPFFTTKAGAVGLGLATAVSVLRGIGGHIALQSEPRIGTTVQLYLPTAEVAATTAPSTTTEAKKKPAGAPGGQVLVVEDQPELAQLIRRLLEPAGYTVTVCIDAENALAEFAAIHDPSLLITDVVMPGMTGPELAVALRERHPGLPVLFMSGYTAAALGPQVQLDGNSGLVEKPFNRSTLLAAVEQLSH
jgi:two-component system, cell cycle sensor histidine kinase and response regulator CckA